jgi:hypothetical protein
LLIARHPSYWSESSEVTVTPGYNAQDIYLKSYVINLRTAPALISYAAVGFLAGGIFQYVKRKRKLRTLRWDIHLSVLFSLILATMIVGGDFLSSIESAATIAVSYLGTAFFDTGLRTAAARIRVKSRQP